MEIMRFKVNNPDAKHKADAIALIAEPPTSEFWTSIKKEMGE